MTDLDITGVLHFHSETGTEGGWWAIMDEKFITPPGEPKDLVCEQCGIIWAGGIKKLRPEPKPSFTYFLEPTGEDEREIYNGELVRTTVDHPIKDGRTRKLYDDEDSFTSRYCENSNARNLLCYENGHKWKQYGPFPSWSYDGLHYVEDGDLLEILGEDGKVIKTIDVKLRRQADQYAEGAYAAGGYLAVHEEPQGIDVQEWESYFLPEKSRARLTKRNL